MASWSRRRHSVDGRVPRMVFPAQPCYADYMSTTDNALEALIRNFAAQLQDLVRSQLSADVTSAVQGALGGKQAPRGRVVAGRNGATARPAKRAAGGKRTPEQIDKLAIQLLSFIDKNPEQRAEQIAKANNLTTGELVLPIKRLLTDKKIKAKGKARGTMYTSAK